jgi:23S rRNA pseudouridine1911/1915/1917 synthase
MVGMKPSALLQGTVPERMAGERVDKALAQLFPDHSRSALQRWLKSGLVLVDDEVPSQRDRLQGGEWVEIAVPPAPLREWLAQPVALNLVYQDAEILVVNKPPGLVVHPGAGNADGTLLNGLLHLDASLSALPRAGIVHRLDKDTSGLMVVARTEPARMALIEQLAAHEVRRVYDGLVTGRVIAGGVIDRPIGRDPHDRRRMTVTAKGKPARTHYRVERRFRAHTLVSCRLETGRTHQIRVHLKDAGFPIVGDPVYGGRLRIPAGASDEVRQALVGFRRQALHACELSLAHPLSGALHRWLQPMPGDMQRLIEALARDTDQERR